MADIYCIFKNFKVLKKYRYFVNFLSLFKFGHLGRSVIWDVGHLGQHRRHAPPFDGFCRYQPFIPNHSRGQHHYQSKKFLQQYLIVHFTYLQSSDSFWSKKGQVFFFFADTNHYFATIAEVNTIINLKKSFGYDISNCAFYIFTQF